MTYLVHFLATVDSFKMTPKARETLQIPPALLFLYITGFTSSPMFWCSAVMQLIKCCPLQSKDVTAFKWCPVSKSQYVPQLSILGSLKLSFELEV